MKREQVSGNRGVLGPMSRYLEFVCLRCGYRETIDLLSDVALDDGCPKCDVEPEVQKVIVNTVDPFIIEDGKLILNPHYIRPLEEQ